MVRRRQGGVGSGERLDLQKGIVGMEAAVRASVRALRQRDCWGALVATAERIRKAPAEAASTGLLSYSILPVAGFPGGGLAMAFSLGKLPINVQAPGYTCRKNASAHADGPPHRPANKILKSIDSEKDREKEERL